MEFKLLSEEAEQLLEWLAEQCNHGAIDLNRHFSEILESKNIDIDSNEKLILVFEELERRYGSMADINHTVQTFDPKDAARQAWKDYNEEKNKIICEKCGEPSLKKKTVTYCSEQSCDYEHTEPQ